ncbi:MAG: type II secretion system protein N [Pseudomonadota bacterium]|nr:type II secretion system protein N [Pseudomonadota bacterium]
MRIFLSLFALFLAVLLGILWLDWPPERPRPEEAGPETPSEAPPPDQLENPIDRLTPVEDKEEFAVVTERPLFLPDRRPPSEEEGAEDVQEQSPDGLDPKRLNLNAVVITPTESSAWVRDAAMNKVVRLRLGDELEGWSVQEILSDRLVLERQGETDTLILRDYENMSPPQRSRRPSAAAKPSKTPRRPAVRNPRARLDATRLQQQQMRD